MNSNYEETLDKNFDRALELCSNSYSYRDLIMFLKEGNIPEKQFAALELSELKSEVDAEIFISNLINCDGKIREAVAQKFTEFITNEKYRDYFSQFPLILAKSTIDINANISRMIIDSLVYLRENKFFGIKYAELLVTYIEEAFEGLDKIIYKDKKYTINKQMFKLYWCLEGLNNYSQYVEEKVLLEILEESLKQTEYTVREKAARIIAKNSKKPLFSDLFLLVQNDLNYYVRETVKDII